MQFAQNYPLSTVTTLQIGGMAKLFVIVQTEDELIQTINYARQTNIPYIIIGEGSNLLVSDSRIDKLVIKNAIEGITKIVRRLKVKSGTLLQHLVDFSIAHGLSGLQKLTGIPGTVGGAVFGNAGAYGQTISGYIQEVICLDPTTEEVTTLLPDECEFDYRDSVFKRKKIIILEIQFRLEPDKSENLRQEADEILEKRLVKYPKGIKCPGSFFKNLVAEKLPKEILNKIPKEVIVYGKVPAGSLLEMVGAKGDKLNGIEIANYHANLFINKGGGQASDFYQLAKKYSDKVYARFSIRLEPEVQLINLPSLT